MNKYKQRSLNSKETKRVDRQIERVDYMCRNAKSPSVVRLSFCKYQATVAALRPSNLSPSPIWSYIVTLTTKRCVWRLADICFRFTHTQSHREENTNLRVRTVFCWATSVCGCCLLSIVFLALLLSRLTLWSALNSLALTTGLRISEKRKT